MTRKIVKVKDKLVLMHFERAQAAREGMMALAQFNELESREAWDLALETGIIPEQSRILGPATFDNKTKTITYELIDEPLPKE